MAAATLLGAACTEVLENYQGACVPDTLACVGKDVGRCRSDGSGYEIFKECAQASPCTGSPADCEAATGGATCTTEADCEGVLGDLGPCREARCDGGTCRVVAAQDSVACDDGNACTTEDACLAGACVGTGVSCSDGNPCTADTCDPATGCGTTPDDTALCSDGSACTVSDHCLNGTCTGAPRDCDDGNACTNDFCDIGTGECINQPESGACDDGDPCTGDDVCVGKKCTGQTKVCPCADISECPTGIAGNPCAGSYLCTGGFCAADPSTAVQCSQAGLGPCEIAECAPIGGQPACVVGPRQDGTACDDGDACTTQDRCLAGLCKGTVDASTGGCGKLRLRGWLFVPGAATAAGGGYRLRAVLGAPQILGTSSNAQYTLIPGALEPKP